MSLSTTIVAIHALSTIAMTGVIWFVQLVHYPLFDMVGADDFARYEQQHALRTTWLVAPLMVAELTSSAGVLLLAEGPALPLAFAGATLLAVNWASTALVQIPCHRGLNLGFDREVFRRLVNTNWIRTVSWTARSLARISHRLPTASP